MNPYQLSRFAEAVLQAAEAARTAAAAPRSGEHGARDRTESTTGGKGLAQIPPPLNPARSSTA